MISATRSIGLGCMRLSTDSDRSDERAYATITLAVEAGVNLLDTAPSYGLDEDDMHHSERIVGRVLRDLGPRGDLVTVVTKGGLVRQGTAWAVDGRGKSLRASCESSLEALGGRAIDLFLLHAPDPRTSLATSARALARLVADGLVKNVGLSNVSLPALESVSGEMDVAAVEVALGAFDDAPFRSGLVKHCVDRGMTILAHSPLGGPKRAGRLAKDPLLKELAGKHATTAGTVVLAWLYGLSKWIVPIPGARREATALSAARAASLELEADDRARLDGRFPAAARALRQRKLPRAAREKEVVVLMGIQGAGKSRYVERFVADGYERLNRDDRGGTMRGLHIALDERLRAGGTRFVLDNTYPTRAARSEVIEIAERHHARARLLFLDTPLECAQAQAVGRLVERYGKLPGAEELRALSKKDPNAFGPNTQHRYRRELEPPTSDEGWDAVDVIAYERALLPGATVRGLVFAAELALETPGSPAGLALRALLEGHRGRPILSFGFAEGRLSEKLATSVGSLAAELGVQVRFEVCPHGGGPPICWCRPPLPGLVVPWMRACSIDPAATTLLGTAHSHRAMARGLGVIFREPHT